MFPLTGLQIAPCRKATTGGGRGRAHWKAGRRPDETASAAASSALLWRAGDRAVGAIDAAVARFRFQRRGAVRAGVEPLTGVCRHRLGRDVAALRAGQLGDKDQCGLRRRHSAYPVMKRKMTRAGSKTTSRTPTRLAKPSPASSQTRIGVKQHKAETTLPITPNFSKRSLIATPPGPMGDRLIGRLPPDETRARPLRHARPASECAFRVPV